VQPGFFLYWLTTHQVKTSSSFAASLSNLFAAFLTFISPRANADQNLTSIEASSNPFIRASTTRFPFLSTKITTLPNRRPYSLISVAFSSIHSRRLL
jgi:hypothetical protein